MEILSFDKDRKPIPKNYHFVYQIVVTYNGKEILQAETTQAVSQNPFVAFPLKVTEPGKLVIAFTDTHGKTYGAARRSHSERLSLQGGNR